MLKRSNSYARWRVLRRCKSFFYNEEWNHDHPYILHSFNAINKFAARSTSEMWWDSTIDIFDQAFKHFYRVGQEMTCLATFRNMEHSHIPIEGLVEHSHSRPFKRKTRGPFKRNCTVLQKVCQTDNSAVNLCTF